MKNNNITPSGITSILLNKEEKNPGELKSIMTAMSDRDILIQKSGFLFNSSINGNCLCIGILPYFINGERTHHYDIELPESGKCILLGFINSNALLTILFKPESDTYKDGFLPGMADIFRDNYVRLARFFIENGFSADFELDLVTKCLFDEIKMFTDIPATVKELAMQETPFDIS
ncbi:MAG: hypothetical protein KAS17_12935 [Victivallaceae bacterium]|nr:hypothetical protein [Victivallaceae bacterium]